MECLDPETPIPDGRERSLSVSFRVQNEDEFSDPSVGSLLKIAVPSSFMKSPRRESNSAISSSMSNNDIRFGFSTRETPVLRSRRPSLYRMSHSDVTSTQPYTSMITSAQTSKIDVHPSGLHGALSTVTAGDDDTPGTFDDEDLDGRNASPLINRPWFKHSLRVLSLLSLVSAALNTPTTIYSACWLNEAILTTDVFLALVFTLNMLAKMKYRGIFQGRIAYFRVWLNYIDFIALISIYSSIALQVWECYNPGRCVPPVERPDTGWSIVRSPRAMIMLRAGKVFVYKLNLPRELLRKIFRRSGKQLVFVSLFFVFFIAAFAMIGTQIFSDFDHHCTTSNTIANFTLADLAMPDQYCDPKFGISTQQAASSLYSRDSYLSTSMALENSTMCPASNSSLVILSPGTNHFGCPGDMTCRDIDSERTDRRLGTFEDLGHSLLTVYESSSQELWVFLMYSSAEVVQDNSASYAFFMTLIFLLSWLVENVFIAILIETFADMRAEVFVNLVSNQRATTQVLRETDLGLQLVTLKGESIKSNLDKVRAFILSPRFYNVVMVVVVLNSVINALGTAPGVEMPILDRDSVVFPIEIFCTILFNLETVAFIWCLGYKRYFQRKLYLFQFALAVGSTVNLIPAVWNLKTNYFHIFQVLRLLRIIRANRSIKKFINRILGGGTRLFVLLVMTLLFLIAFSLVSQNAFCYIHNVQSFDTFEHSFVSMFQMIMQEGWVELTSMVARSAKYPYITSIYFIFFHLFASLYLLSTFVAVILDNLEYPESVKREKQLLYDKIPEEGGTDLPLRLRTFRWFKPHPRVVRLHNMPVDFTQPLISETVMRTFIESGEALQQKAEQPRPLLPPLDGYCHDATSSGPQHFAFERTQSCRSGVSFQTLSEVPLSRSRFNLHPLPVEAVSEPDSASQHAKARNSVPSITIAGAPAVDRTYEKRRAIHETILQRVIELRDLQASSEENGDLLVPEGRASRLKRNQEARQRKRLMEEEKLREDYRLFDKVLCLLDRDSTIRRFCQRLTDARPPSLFESDSYHIFGYKRTLSQVLASATYLEWFMVVVIIYSTTSLLLEESSVRAPESTFHFVNDVVFLGAMSVELILKTIAHGVLFTPKAAFGSSRSCLDLVIYLTTLIYLATLPASGPSAQLSSGTSVLLVMRCLRPLRLVTLIPQLRRVIFELFIGKKETGKTTQQGKDIAYVTIIFFMFIFFFASYGTQLYSGVLTRCNDITITTQESCVGEFEVPLTVSLHLFLNDTPPLILVPRVWRTPRLFDFDDILSAYLALFEVITLEGWLDVRDVLMEQTSVFSAIYIHCYVFFGVLVGLTLFVGVIIFNFNKNSGTALLTVDQRRFYDLRSRLIIVQPNRFPPRPSHSRLRSLLFDMISSQKWNMLEIFLLLVNSGTLAIKWKSGDSGTLVVMSISIACNCVFLIQTGIKMIALSPSGFFQSHRLAFEFTLGILGLAFVVLFIIMESNYSGTSDLWEVTRELGIVSVMLRFISLTGKGETMKMLMLTVVQTVVKSSYIILCLLVFVMTYALIGNVLFSNVKYGEALGRHANFETPANALVMMVRIITGEDWNRLMRDVMINEPGCISDEDCGSAPAAVFYFCSFYLMVAFVFLNLFIAVLLENFSLFYSSDEDALLSTKELQMFQSKWDIVDPSRSGEIPIRFVSFLVLLLEGALHVHLDLLEERMLFEQMLLEMERYAQQAQRRSVKFQDVLGMLAYRSVDINTSLTLEEYIARKQLEDNIRLEVSRRIIRTWVKSRINYVRMQMEKGETVMFTPAQTLAQSKDESTRNSQYIPTQDPLAEGSQLRNSSSEDTICHGLLSSADSSGIPFSASSLSDDPKNPLSHQRSSSVEDARSVFNTDPQLWTKEKTTSLNKWFDNYTSDEDDYDMV